TAGAGGAGATAGGSGSTTITGCMTGAGAAAVKVTGGVAAGAGSDFAGRQRTGIVTSGGVSSLTSTKSHSAWARAGRFTHRPTASARAASAAATARLPRTASRIAPGMTVP